MDVEADNLRHQREERERQQKRRVSFNLAPSRLDKLLTISYIYRTQSL